jgi:hypothetical protein
MNQIVIGSKAASERPLFWNPRASCDAGLQEKIGGSSHSLPGRPIGVVIALSILIHKAIGQSSKPPLKCVKSAARAAAGSMRLV